MRKRKEKVNGNAKSRKPWYKRWYVWFAAVMVIGNVIPKDTKEASTTPTVAEETTVEETTERELTKEEQLREAVESVVGKESLDIFNYVPDNNFTLIKFYGSESLTHSMTVKGMYIDIKDILKNIQPIIDTDVDFNVVYPLQDKYGNVENEIVIKATFSNETINKINYENVLFENIPDLADDWWQHNALNLK